MRISKASSLAAQYACKHFHYSHSVPMTLYRYNVWNDDGEWCGVIIYGLGANVNIAATYDKWQGQVYELERVALNGKQGHGKTSQAVAMTLPLPASFSPQKGSCHRVGLPPRPAANPRSAVLGSGHWPAQPAPSVGGC